MKYSIILPSYDPELRHHEMFVAMLKSIDLCSKGADYELVIRKNGRSYVDSMNDGMKTARGEYLIFCQDDMLIEDNEWLEKLTDDEAFVTTHMEKFSLDNSDCPNFAMFGISRKTFEKIGLLDEIFKDGVCYEDNDYVFRMRELNIAIKCVSVSHKHYGGMATDLYLTSKKDLVEKNKKLFTDKWNIKSQ